MEEKDLTPAAEAESAALEESEAPEPEKPSKHWLDATWDFFASVPVGVFLIFIIAAASVGGSLISQEGMYGDWRAPAEFYPFRYGPFWGNLLYKTGMTRMYTSWWFMSLLFMMGASLIICSLERFVPLWNAVQRPNIAPPEAFVKHLKSRFEYKPAAGVDPLAPLATALKAARYTVIQKDGRLYADKGRWGRWGPYILHIGLLLVLAGAMVRVFPGAYMDKFVWVRDDTIVKVPEATWFVKNEKFTVETYENGQPKSFRTEAVVLEADGTEAKRAAITMNNPLAYKWVELYQSSYKRELGKAVVQLTERKTGTKVGTFDLDLHQPERQYTVGSYTVKVNEYYPDFGLEGGKPVSRSSEINNPGVVLEVIGPDGKAYKNWYFVAYPEMEFDPTTPIKLTTADLTETMTTGLKVKKDLGIPIIWFGLFVTSVAVCITFYMSHRRYWALAEGGRVFVGGWTNRNQASFQSELQRLGHLIDPKTNPQKDETEGEER